MPLFISSLNSGSNGNCYYIANDNEAILIDVGISCREIEKRMKRLELSMTKVKAIFISHEHSDHIRGLRVLAKKYQILIYITLKTLIYSRLALEEHLIKPFKAFDIIRIGDLEVYAFPKAHDAIDPHSFLVSGEGVNIGVFTDIGEVCDQLVTNFKRCHAVFLETNYDDEMLDSGNYPFYLKHRIRGGKGHLSNKKALDLFVSHRPSYLSHVFLSHLSANNNCPLTVQNLFAEYADNVEIILAPRRQETSVYCIGATSVESTFLSPSRARQL